MGLFGTDATPSDVPSWVCFAVPTQHHSTCPCGSTLQHMCNTTWHTLVALPLCMASSQLPKPQVVALDWVQQFLLPCSSGQLCILYTGDQVH